MSNCWTILGLAPTSDQTAIRRAYAKKLKVTNPEDDPQGFMALRAALEQAQQWARWQAYDEPDDGADDETDTGAGVSEAAEAPAPANAADNALAAEPEPWGGRPTVDTPAPDTPEALEAARFAAEREADFADLHAREEALYTAVTAGEEAAMLAALERLLAAPALGDIAARAITGEWLARLIAEHFPASDAIVEPAIAGFDWQYDVRGVSPAVAAVLDRLEVWRFVNTASRPHGQLHQGWRALTAKNLPGWRRRLGAALTGGTRQVRALLAVADHQLPGVADWLDPDAMAWWRRFLARDGFDLALLWLVPLGLPLGLFLATGLHLDPGADLALMALVAVLAPIAAHWLVARPRRRVLASPVQPAWADGWRAVLALPLIAMVLPGSPAAFAGLTLLGLLFIGWTWVMAGRFGAGPKLGLASLGGALVGFQAITGSQGDSAFLWLVASVPVGIAAWRGRDDFAALAARLPRPEWLLGISGPALVAAVAFLPPLPVEQRFPLAALAATLGYFAVSVASQFAGSDWSARLMVMARVAIILLLGQLLGDLPQRSPAVPDPASLTAPALQHQPLGESPPMAQPTGPVDGWLTVDDMPPGAFVRPGRIALVIDLDIDPGGNITSCIARQTGGTVSIESASCQAIVRRARFAPSPVAGGVDVPDHWRGRLVWIVSERAAAAARAASGQGGAATRATGGRTVAAKPPDIAPPRPTLPPGRPPELLVDANSLVTGADFPAGLFQRDTDYHLAYRLDIDRTGKVTGCTIVTSSGIRLADRAACAAASARGRFAPARAGDGTALPGTWGQELSWKTVRRPRAVPADEQPATEPPPEAPAASAKTDPAANDAPPR